MAPRIPDEFSLGGLPGMDSGRRVATYDTTAEGRGLEALGEGFTRAGASLGNVAERDDQLDVARAKSNFLTKKVELDNEFSRDTNYLDLQKRYDARLKQIHDESVAFIPNARKRERFALETNDDLAKGRAWASNVARKQEIDANIADANTRLKAIRDAALKTEDETERVRLIDTGSQILQGLVEKGFITREGMRSTWDSWRQDYAKAWIGIQPDEKKVELLAGPAKTDEQILNRILRVEGTAKNPKSSAVGAGQFIDSTWLEIIRTKRPDLAAGKSDAEILAMRADRNLGRQMTEAYRQDNIRYLTQSGVEATAANQYLAHFLGPAGAVAVAKADPNRPVADVLTEVVGARQAQRMVNANLSILGGKTAGTVAQWAGRKMGGETGSPADFLPYDQQQHLRQQAEQNLIKQRTAASGARGEQIQRQIIDAEAGVVPLIPRAQIETDPLLDEGKRNQLLKAYDSAAGDIVKFREAMAKFQDPNGGSFNPYDKDEQKHVDKIFTALGGDTRALQAVVERTKTVPDTAMKKLRGDVVSSDPQRVAGALTIASNLMNISPTVFSGEGGENQIEKAVTAFRHDTETYGMTVEEAAKRAIERNTPEYKNKIATRMKSEDVDATIKKEIKNGTLESDLKSAFNLGLPRIGRPTIEANPKARQAALSDYAELVKEKYLETGDMSLAKKQAQTQLKKVWGVSYVNGSFGGVFMKLPPERAPAFAGVDDAAGQIAGQVTAAIKADFGEDVPRGKIMFSPIPGGQTARAYMAGEPPPYQVSWIDKNGNVQTTRRAFVPDVAAMRAKASEDRRVGLEAARTGAQAAEDARAAAAGRVGRGALRRAVEPPVLDTRGSRSAPVVAPQMTAPDPDIGAGPLGVP